MLKQKLYKLKSFLFKVIFVLITLFALFLLLDFLFPLDRQRLSKPASTAYFDRNNHLIRIKLSSDGFWRFPTLQDDIPPLLKKSVIAFEDQYFYYHFGINPFSILRALIQNITHQRVIGASTITMQVSRMMHQYPRTIYYKLIELFNALQLEFHYTKDEILTLYFNLAPYGGNIEGVKSAAMFYFQKPLHALTISQIAILTIIPKNPNANRPDRQQNLQKRRDTILQNMVHKNIISPEQSSRAKQETITAKRLHIPFDAPHFTNQIRANQSHIHTTLDSKLQNFVRAKLAQQIKNLKAHDVHNAAAIIIHNPTMEILTYIGSHDFNDHKHGGQNNGVTMIRSPGSTLKPFIYARALDLGLITPKQQLYDIDLFLQGYKPQNFSKNFTGLVSASEALQRSLNIPAIALNHLLKEYSLYDLLQDANISSIDRNKAYYGDAIALGGCGISLQNLTLLYTALANEGFKKEVHFTKDKSTATKTKLFSKEAAYLISDILSDASRVTLSGYWESTQDIPKVAFKTGTSAASKDLLTIGYTPEYSIGVWFGNFSGKKTQNLTGLHSASDVVLDIFHYINQQHKLSWFKQPKNIQVQMRCVDALTLATCQTFIEDLTIKDVIPHLPCESIRPETLTFLMQTNKITSLLDLQSNPCYPTWQHYKPIITTPGNHAVLSLNHTLPITLQQIKLNCYSFEKNQNILWFIDNLPQIKAISGQALYYYFAPGKHEIGCLDTQAKLKVHHITIESL